MKRTYETPIIVANHNLAEGVYLASGAGHVNVSYTGVMDRWATGGKAAVTVNCPNVTGMVSLTLTFNDSIDDADTSVADANLTYSGQSVKVVFDGAANASVIIGVHLNHGTSIDSLQLTDYNYSVS